MAVTETTAMEEEAGSTSSGLQYCLDKIFEILDKDGSGTINFRELKKKHSSYKKVMKTYDVNRDGQISKQELGEQLTNEEAASGFLNEIMGLSIEGLAELFYKNCENVAGLKRAEFSKLYAKHKETCMTFFGQPLAFGDFTKGDENVDNRVSKIEFIEWLRAQDVTKAGVEKTEKHTIEGLAELFYANCEDVAGLKRAEFTKLYKEYKESFIKFFGQPLSFGDFRKGDENMDNKVSKTEFIEWLRCQDVRTAGVEKSDKVIVAQFLEELFNLLDEDKSGLLDKSELKNLYPKLVDSPAEYLVEYFDSSEDGQLSKEELSQLFMDHQTGKLDPELLRERLNEVKLEINKAQNYIDELFAILDKDNNGRLDKSELRNLYPKLVDDPSDYLLAYFDKSDEGNMNNAIEKEELKQLFIHHQTGKLNPELLQERYNEVVESMVGENAGEN